MTVEEPLISFHQASLGYGRRAVLSGVDLEIRRGAFLGILGANGSGKTTVLKTVLGLLELLKGRLEMKGFNGPVRFGYVPQREKPDAIYPLSTFEVVEMGTYRSFDLLARFRLRMQSDLVRRCLKECGAVDFAPRRYSDLSGGQKQRVLIARALAAEPELLALDEPLSGIDITTQRALLKLFKDIKEHHRLTVLMISHRLQAEKDLFTDIAWVDEGTVDWGPAARMLAKRHITQIFEGEL